MEKFKNSVKKFVEDHKTAICVTITVFTCYKINQAALKGHNEFLVQKGLFDEFYTPSD